MNRQPIIIGVVAVLLIAGTTAFLKRAQSSRSLGIAGVKVVPAPAGDSTCAYLPEWISGHQSREIEVSPQELATLPKDTTFGKRVYRASDGLEFAVNIVLMGTDRTSIHKPEFCLVGQGLTIVRRELQSVRVESPHPYDLPVWRYVCSRDATTSEGQTVKLGASYVFWFVSENAVTTSHWEMAWLSAKDLILRGKLRRWGYISCFSMYPPQAEQLVWERTRAFLARTVPEFQTAAGPRIASATPEAAGLTQRADAR